MKSLKISAFITVMLLLPLLFTGCDLYTYTSGTQTSYENPQWAPPYYAGARYYYLPDIESYYDLSSHDFIYLNNGQWVYSQTLPSIYADYDLNNGFAVVLDVNIYQPWMHHHYYVSHYPRYYYRDYYDHSNIPYVRGFNENSRSAIYWGENERNRARSWDDQNVNSNRQFKYTKVDQQQQNNRNNRNNQGYNNQSTVNNNKNNQSDRNSTYNQNTTGNNSNSTGNREDNTVNRPTQNENSTATHTSSPVNTTRVQQPATITRTTNTNYYGRTIGQPVKVQKQMRNPAATPQKAANKKNDNSTIRSDQNTNSRR
jgi:hypothetical protein